MATERHTQSSSNMDRQCPFCGSMMDSTANLCPACGKFSKPTYQKPGAVQSILNAVVKRLSRADIPIRRELQAISLIGLTATIIAFGIYYNSADARFARMCSEMSENGPWIKKRIGRFCSISEYVDKEDILLMYDSDKKVIDRLEKSGETIDENGNFVSR